MIFQAMFAIITPALIIGAFAERMKFSGFPGILRPLGDSSSTTPSATGYGGLAAGCGIWARWISRAAPSCTSMPAWPPWSTALVIGKRKNFDLDEKPIPPHNLPLTAIGTGLLWFGWFGFNAGSALAANGLAVNAFVVTNTSAAAAGLSWAVMEWFCNGKPTLFGTVSGAVAGLVAITPAAGFVSVLPAIIIGLTVSVLCFLAVSVIKRKFGYDDSLDAFGVHGVGGIWGALATGLFASKAAQSRRDKRPVLRQPATVADTG